MFIIDKINGQTNINVASFVLFEHRKEKEEEEINVHIELLAQQKKKTKREGEKDRSITEGCLFLGQDVLNFIYNHIFNFLFLN